VAQDWDSAYGIPELGHLCRIALGASSGLKEKMPRRVTNDNHLEVYEKLY
jgi:hypothetical protein